MFQRFEFFTSHEEKGSPEGRQQRDWKLPVFEPFSSWFEMVFLWTNQDFPLNQSLYIGGGWKNIIYFHPYVWWKWSVLTNISWMGWNHLEDHPSGCKWLRTMVSKSPKDRVVPLPNGHSMADKWVILTTSINWDDPPSRWFLRNKGLIAGLIKGNQWLKKTLFPGGDVGGGLVD